MSRVGVFGLTAVLVACAFSANANAASFTATDTTDAPLATPSGKTCVSTHGGSCTLRAAVQAANNTGGANAITVRPGTYKLTIAPTPTTPGSDTNDPAHGDLDVLSGDALTLSGGGSANTTVNANGVDRAFAVQQGASLTVSALMIENGVAASPSSGGRSGGGIYADGGLVLSGDVVMENDETTSNGGAIGVDSHAPSFSATRSTFSDNTASTGGAIYVDASATTTATISQSLFERNDTTTGQGGAIDDNDSGAFTVTNSQFSDNIADNGSGQAGAIYNDTPAAFTVTGSSFDDNRGDDGGAIYDNNATAETISASRFTDNDASTGGGALYINNSAATDNKLLGDEFDFNRADDNGGAIFWNEGTLAISGSSIVGNRAGADGGGIYQNEGQAFTMINTTISGNHAAVLGGGVDFDDLPVLSWANNTIAFNSALATDGGGVYNPSGTTTGGTGVVDTIIADNTGGDCGDNGADSHFKAGDDAGNNLDSDATCFGGLGKPGDKTAIDPLLSQAAANGGPVLTDALNTGSPAIDGGSATKCATTDARGVPRPQGAACDIGAFEASKPAVSITAPGNNSKLKQHATLKAKYSCSEAGLTSLIVSCKGPAASGAAIDTNTTGKHTFTVTATDAQGLTASVSVTYTVTAPPPPNTNITHHQLSGDKLTIKFKGSGGVGKRSFKCKLDKGKFKSCSSPKSFSSLAAGKHTVAVEAVDSRHKADPTPAKLHFTVK